MTDTSKLVCIHCGCSDMRACPGGCAWVSTDPPLCSTCLDRELETLHEKLRQDLAWRGPNGRSMALIGISRKQAEALNAWLSVGEVDGEAWLYERSAT